MNINITREILQAQYRYTNHSLSELLHLRNSIFQAFCSNAADKADRDFQMAVVQLAIMKKRGESPSLLIPGLNDNQSQY